MGGDTAGVASPTDWRQTDLAKRVLRCVEASVQAAAREVDAITSWPLQDIRLL